MKKFLAGLLTLALVISFAGCGGGGGTTTPQGNTYELGLVTDIGTIDDRSFNQGAWEGLKKYAEETSKTYQYFQPLDQSMSSYNDQIETAIEAGSKVVVTPGFLFENAIHKSQSQFPETYFILIDGAPNNVTDWDTNATYDGGDMDFTIGPNTYSVFFKEEQAGFLAGYAAVKDGYRKLGFMGGMAVPAVVGFGYGFVQGADYAAAELGISDVDIVYHYTGVFSASPEIQAKAASWYSSGVEVIFACGGSIGNSIMRAAENSNSAVIGVDVDQSNESDTVITSAMKNITISVYEGIKAYYEGSFPGGESVHLGAESDGVGLPMATSKFNSFSQAEYDEIFAKLKTDEDGLATSLLTDESVENVEAIKPANLTVHEEI